MFLMSFQCVEICGVTWQTVGLEFIIRHLEIFEVSYSPNSFVVHDLQDCVLRRRKILMVYRLGRASFHESIDLAIARR